MAKSKSRRITRFQPDFVANRMAAELEPRIALSGGSIALGPTAATATHVASQNGITGRRVPRSLIGAATRGVHFRDSLTTRVSDAIDREFDSFTADYLQAQGAYLASSTRDSKVIFRNVTRLRVNLLAQQLTQVMSRIPNTLARSKGAASTPLQQFMVRRITAPPPADTLLGSLLDPDTIPPIGTPAADATLYTLAATNAIETARVATVNGAKFAAYGIFAKKH